MTSSKHEFSHYHWLNQPESFEIMDSKISIKTDPNTDYWQRTHYGFQKDNGHAFMQNYAIDFTFAVRTDFNTNELYDQCGIMVYLDKDNWVKASCEYENTKFSRLGSVVTSLGYSDWATVDISAEINTIWYKVSRRGQDFYIEYSLDGKEYKQMRILHLHKPFKAISAGIYACSPKQSRFIAEFSEFWIGPSSWGG